MKARLALSLFSAFMLAGALSAATGPNVIVSLNKRLLILREGDKTVKVYHVAVGTKAHPTPTGNFNVAHIVWNPKWVPPDEKWAKGKKPTPPGHPDNPMKVVKIFFQEPDYYIHGTDRDDSIGSAASHGCVRMTEAEVADVARWFMEHGGAGQSDAWYDAVTSGKQSSDVRLHRAVPLIVAR